LPPALVPLAGVLLDVAPGHLLERAPAAQREPVRVRIETKQPNDDDVDEVIVAPGASDQFDLDDINHLELTVYRVSDNFLLFLDSWDEDDLRHDNDFISVTVTP
jgi:hypothetical protein